MIKYKKIALNILLFVFLTIIIPLGVEAEGEQYELGFRFFVIPENPSEPTKQDLEWFFENAYDDDGNFIAPELIEGSDNTKVMPGSYIVVVPTVKALVDDAEGIAFSLNYRYDTEVFESMQGDDYNLLDTDALPQKKVAGNGKLIG